jgi:histone deacetylase 1/2
VSTQFGLTIKAVQCDNGREFDNSTSRAFFLSHGVQLRMSCPYTSQIGKAERMIRTTTETMRTLLFQASLPAHFWAESLHASTYLLNRLPSIACPAPTPHHALFGTPRYDHLRVFGCACYPNTAATASHKLAPRSTQCVFLRYSPNHKGYHCFDLASRRVLISRHVVFDESVFSYSTTCPPPTTSELDLFSSFPIDMVD